MYSSTKWWGELWTGCVGSTLTRERLLSRERPSWVASTRSFGSGQQRRDAAAAIGALLRGECDDVGGQSCHVKNPKPCRSMLSEKLACQSSTLEQSRIYSSMCDGIISSCGALRKLSGLCAARVAADPHSGRR